MSVGDNYTTQQQKALGRTVTNQIKQIEAISKSSNGLDSFPALSSGGRTFVTIAGKPAAVCLEFSYSVTTDYEEIRTVDSQLPWDIMPGQIKISGTLTRFVDPESSFEADGMFATMQSSLHQPFVELLVQDSNGIAQFFCKGMFVSMNAKYAVGQLTINSATFVGIQYQHYVYQEFTAYPNDFASELNRKLNEFKKNLSEYGA